MYEMKYFIHTPQNIVSQAKYLFLRYLLAL